MTFTGTHGGAITTTIRRSLVLCLAMALALVGLAVPRASADAAVPPLAGTGPGESAHFTLPAGLYTIDFSYGAGDDTMLQAWLANEVYPDYAVPVAFDGADAGATKRVVWVDGSEGELWFDVDMAEAGRTWSATIAEATVPTAPVRSFAASGKGLNTSGLYLLEQGDYSFTVSYSGNLFVDGDPFPIALLAVDTTGGVTPLIVTNETTMAASGTRTGSLTLDERAVIWIDTDAWATASWKVALGPRLTATPKPTISGTTAVGKTLTAKAVWAPSSAKLTYQWYRGSTAIKGATKKTYKLTAADKGKKIKVTVKGPAYEPTSKTSAATKAIKAGKLATATPKISGKAKVGKKLTAKPGTWGPGTVKLTYQWYRGSAKIKGATKKAYTLKKADKGKRITVKVKGVKSGYGSVTKASKATAKVA
jgi:hypothetical protein